MLVSNWYVQFIVMVKVLMIMSCMKAPSPTQSESDEDKTIKKNSGDFSRMVGFLKYNSNELTQKDEEQRHNSQRALEA